MGRIVLRLLGAFGVGVVLLLLGAVGVYAAAFSAARGDLQPTWTSDGQMTIVALGDSYMSGEGAEAFLPGTDGPDNKCRRSSHAYPFLVAEALRADLVFVPCSGAVVEHIASVTVAGVLSPTPHPHSEGLQQIEALKQSPDADMVLLSVGGNDAKFAEIIQMCMGFRKQCSDVGEAWLENLRDVIVPRLEILLDEIRMTAPQARILVTSYPAPLDIQQRECGELGLAEGEVGFVGKFVDTLKEHLNQAAVAAGAELIDMTAVFDGYSLCSNTATPALNAWDPQKPQALTLDPVDILRGSYHPTEYGHQLMAQRILDHLEDFQRPAGEQPPVPPTTGAPPVEAGTPWSPWPSNPCTPGVTREEASVDDNQSIELTGAAPGTQICYRTGNDPFTATTVAAAADGTVVIQFSRPPVRGQGGLRQIFYMSGTGDWILLEIHSSIAASAPPPVDTISAWFGGHTQMWLALAATLLVSTAAGGFIIWGINVIRSRIGAATSPAPTSPSG